MTEIQLGAVIDIVMGQAPPGKDCNKDGKGVPFVKAGEFGVERPVIREWTTNPKKIAEKGDVFLCVVGATCGKINLGEDCAIGRSVAALRPNKDKIDQRFLYYFMSGEVMKLRRSSLGAAQTVISKDMINGISLYLPPLSEQQHIVAKLDVLFAEIDTLNQINSIRKAELIKFKKALLMKTLSIEKSNLVRLSDVCELIYGKPLDKIDRLENDGVPAYGANGIKTYSTKALSDGPSIIIGRKGSAGELKKVSSAFWALDVTYYTKINQKLIDLDFLYYTLSNMNLPSMAKGVKPGINRNDVYKRMIYLPSLVEQKRIVSLLDASYKEIKTVNDSLFKLKNNCQALITAILSQELQSGEAA